MTFPQVEHRTESRSPIDGSKTAARHKTMMAIVIARTRRNRELP